jgi:hypothetical protein
MLQSIAAIGFIFVCPFGGALAIRAGRGIWSSGFGRFWSEL